MNITKTTTTTTTTTTTMMMLLMVMMAFNRKAMILWPAVCFDPLYLPLSSVGSQHKESRQLNSNSIFSIGKICSQISGLFSQWARIFPKILFSNGSQNKESRQLNAARFTNISNLLDNILWCLDISSDDSQHKESRQLISSLFTIC